MDNHYSSLVAKYNCLYCLYPFVAWTDLPGCLALELVCQTQIQTSNGGYQVKQEKEVYKSKINFFINLVHEIRTPLSLIRLPLEKLQETQREGRDVKYLSVIDKNVNYLLGITNQLLDFQKMESGALQLNQKRCSINELVQDIYSQFTSPAELKGLELKLVLPDNKLVLMIDPEKISKILVNLMGNALKYSRTHVELKLSVTDTNIRISVSDDGPGVPDGQKIKVFEAFYNCRETRSLL